MDAEAERTGTCVCVPQRRTPASPITTEQNFKLSHYPHKHSSAVFGSIESIAMQDRHVSVRQKSAIARRETQRDYVRAVATLSPPERGRTTQETLQSCRPVFGKAKAFSAYA